MKQDLVIVNTHGVLEETLGYKTWKLAIKSVGAALNAIEVLSKRKLYKFLYTSEKKGIKYVVLVNGREILSPEIPNENNTDSIQNSELCATIHGLKTIDIVPIIQGADLQSKLDWMTPIRASMPFSEFLPRDVQLILSGIVLIIAGAVVTYFGGGAIGVPMILAGIGLLSAGIINMLTKPPEEPEIQARQKTSYLFSGPSNVSNEGGPVPIGYGRLIIGSSVVSAAYQIESFVTEDQTKIPTNI